MRFRTTTLLLVLLLTTARTTPARPVSKDTSRAAAFRAGCPKADGANLAVELRGGELRIRFAESEGRNLRYTFRRCMFNELFTFSGPWESTATDGPERITPGGRAAPSARPGTSEYRSRPTAGASGATRRCGPVK